MTIMVCIALASPSVAADKITLAALEDFPPFQWAEDGKVIGVDADIIREVFKRLGMTPDFKIMPWTRGLRSVKAGIVDALPAALKNEERETFLFYPSEPIHIQKNVVMVKKGAGMNINSLSDLKGKAVGVVRGFSYGAEFDSITGLDKTVCKDQQELVRILAAGRIDAAMGSEMPLMYNARQIGLQDSVETGYIIVEYPAYTVFSRKLGENGRSLAQKFDETLKAIKAEGMDRRLMDQYVK